MHSVVAKPCWRTFLNVCGLVLVLEVHLNSYKELYSSVNRPTKLHNLVSVIKRKSYELYRILRYFNFLLCGKQFLLFIHIFFYPNRTQKHLTPKWLRDKTKGYNQYKNQRILCTALSTQNRLRTGFLQFCCLGGQKTHLLLKP